MLTLDELNQGGWAEREGLWQYRLNVDVETEGDSFIVNIIVPAGNAEIEYIARGIEGSLDVNAQDGVDNGDGSNFYTAIVG